MGSTTMLAECGLEIVDAAPHPVSKVVVARKMC